ncbi:unnamed protein product, partial [Allacma fusca]
GNIPGVKPPQAKKESLTQGLKTDLTRLSGRFTVTKASLSTPPGAPPQVQAGPGAFIPLHHQHQAHCQLVTGQVKGQIQEMEYIQVDTSYQGGHRGSMPAQLQTPHRQSKSKMGMLTQLIDKVRSGKDDRKKSSASGVSSSSSGGTIPHPPPPPTGVPRPMIMKDSQFQYNGPYPDNSAVAALARSSTSLRRNGSSHGSRSESARPVYTRAKSFVKSKSDDERPPSKLSKHSRARSAGALETQSLLKALNLEDPKEAVRLLTLYQSLSRGLLASERQMGRLQQQQQQQQQQQLAQQQQQQHGQQQQQHAQQQQHQQHAQQQHLQHAQQLQQQHAQQLQQQQQQTPNQPAHQRFYNYMLNDTQSSQQKSVREASTDPMSLPYPSNHASLKYSRSASD